MNTIKSARSLRFVIFLYWAGTTVMVSFMVLLLGELGYSQSECGYIASQIAAGTMLLQPLLGYLSDTLTPVRRLLIACLIPALPLAIALLFAGRGILLSAGVVALSLLCEPQATLIDNYILRLGESLPSVDYGKVRTWGPAGSAAASIVAGALGWVFSLKLMFALVAIFFAACIIALMRCEEVQCPNRHKAGIKPDAGTRADNASATGAGSTGFMGAIKLLLHTPSYLLFIGCCCLFQFAMRTATTFLGLVVAAQGGGSMQLGVLLFIVYAGQTPFLLWAGTRIKAGVGCGKIFVLAMIFGALRLALLALQLPFWVMAVFQLLQAAQTGMYLRVFVQHITDITPPNIHATATSVGAAVSLGAGQIAGGVVHGLVIEHWGAAASAMLSTGVMAGAIALFLLIGRMLAQPKLA